MIRCSTRADGDFHRTAGPLTVLEERRRAFVNLPWTMPTQHHGVDVIRVARPGSGDGAPADIVITDALDAVLGCWAADCAPLVLIGDHREFAIVHGGWRGLAGGVVDAAVAAFREPVVAGVLGPVIGPCCYEFGVADLAAVAAGVHAEPGVITSSTRTATTTASTTALDMPAAIAAACAHHGIELTTIGGCTGCTYDGFSHRAGRDPQRHVVAAWRPSGDAT